MPYLANGLIDWGKLDDDLEPQKLQDDIDFEVEVALVGSVVSNPRVAERLRDYLPAKLNFHPYFHTPASSQDCYLVGH